MDWEAFFRNYRRPDFIPGFEIVNKLGSGAFGEVFKARKTSIGKFYAVKFLKIDDPAARVAVLREIDGLTHLAQLDHPNLVSIEDQGEVCGIPYVVMSWGGDETLKTRLAAGPIPRKDAAELFLQILDGVSALHGRSIVHFDLKPANVFIRGAHARVGDYGLSKLMSETRNSLTFGRGTPHYLAPEMLRRRGDARSDIYSLGVILFEMLTGDVPFRGDTEWAVLARHESEPVSVPADVPPALAAVITRAMAKAPEDRFAGAREFRSAFVAALGDAVSGLAGPAGDGTAAEWPDGGVPAEDPLRRAGEVAGRIAGRAQEWRQTLARAGESARAAMRTARRRARGAVEAAQRAYREERGQAAERDRGARGERRSDVALPVPPPLPPAPEAPAPPPAPAAAPPRRRRHPVVRAGGAFVVALAAVVWLPVRASLVLAGRTVLLVLTAVAHVFSSLFRVSVICGVCAVLIALVHQVLSALIL